MKKGTENIILLTIDCLRYDRCSFTGYGQSTTPFLDEIAAESYVFNQAIAPGTWTSESFPGILAGLHAPDVSYYDRLAFKAIPENVETIGTQMHKVGFDTVATVTNSQLTSDRGFSTGFHDFANVDTEEIETKHLEKNSEASNDYSDRLKNIVSNQVGVNKVMYELNQRDSLWTIYTIPAIANQVSGYFSSWPYTRAEDVLAHFYNQISDRNGNKPIFGWTHLMDLHAPLHHESIREGGLCNSSKLKCFISDINRIGNNSAPIYQNMYDSSLSYIDKQIKRFVDLLKERDLWSNTTLIVTSDHGEALGERGVYGHWNHYPYDELIRVPLIVRPAGGIRKKELNHTFSLSWLHELLAELTETNPIDFPAKSGVENHLDNTPKETIAVTDSVRGWSHLVVVRSKSGKLVRNYHPRKPRNESEHYAMVKHLGATASENVDDLMESRNFYIDLATDPKENYPQKPSAAPNKMRCLAEQIKTDPKQIPERKGKMTEEVESRLEDLGYLS